MLNLSVGFRPLPQTTRVSSLALDGMVSNAALLSTFDVDDMPTEALLFQTGLPDDRVPGAAGGKDVSTGWGIRTVKCGRV